MPNFIIPEKRECLMRYLGDLSQLGGVKRYTLSEGRAQGVDAIDVETGSGLCFTVLPGRGMDIAWTKFKGVPISYVSKTGVVNAAHYDPRGMNWLRSFFAGLLTTCGLCNAGSPSPDSHVLVGEMEHGLHGRISNTPAYAVHAEHRWDGDICRIKVSGTVRESSLHTENITLYRTFDTILGSKFFTMTDVITNEGFVSHPLMLLYHINIGWPLIDVGSRLVTASKSVRSGHEYSEERKAHYAEFEPPEILLRETSYMHDFITDDSGNTEMAVINDNLTLAFALKYKPAELPCFNQWKQMNAAEYVLGLEPGTTFPHGLDVAKSTGNIVYLEPGQTKTTTIEFGLLDDENEIAKLETRISKLVKVIK